MLQLIPLLFAQAEDASTAGDAIFDIVKVVIAVLKFGVGIWGLYCIAWMWQHLGRRSFSRRAGLGGFLRLHGAGERDQRDECEASHRTTFTNFSVKRSLSPIAA